MFLFRDNTLLDTGICFSLRKIYGLGLRKALYICSRAGIDHGTKLSDINAYQFELMHILLKGLVVSEVRIKRRMEFNIAKLTKTKNIKGLRHLLSLPVHGQRTRTNACTQRLKRAKRVIISNRRGRRRGRR